MGSPGLCVDVDFQWLSRDSCDYWKILKWFSKLAMILKLFLMILMILKQFWWFWSDSQWFTSNSCDSQWFWSDSWWFSWFSSNSHDSQVILSCVIHVNHHGWLNWKEPFKPQAFLSSIWLIWPPTQYKSQAFEFVWCYLKISSWWLGSVRYVENALIISSETCKEV